MDKRVAEVSPFEQPDAKKVRQGDITLVKQPVFPAALKKNQLAAPSMAGNAQLQRHRVPQRSSELLAPIVQLTGHQSPVLACCFSPDGKTIASADATGILWNAFGTNVNIGLIQQKQTPITHLQFSHDSVNIYASSHLPVTTLTSITTGQVVQKFTSHTLPINCLSLSPTGTLATASDDSLVNMYDSRIPSKNPTSTIEHSAPILACEWVDTGRVLLTAGIEGVIRGWDPRDTRVPVFVMEHGEGEGVTGLKAHGEMFCSAGLDGCVRVWDARGYCENRTVACLRGVPCSVEKNLVKPAWSGCGRFVTCGSADRTVVVWNVEKERILYKLPGHKGAVNQVDWHPTQPVILSGSIDKTLFLGELAMNVLQ